MVFCIVLCVGVDWLLRALCVYIVSTTMRVWWAPRVLRLQLSASA